jgi:PAS domain S-box-containing protein
MLSPPSSAPSAGTPSDPPDRAALLQREKDVLESTLHAVEQRYRLAIESAELGIWELDPASGRLEWDARCQALFGLSPTAPVDQAVFLGALHADDRPRIEAAIAGALDPSGPGRYHVEHRCLGVEDGVERWAASQALTTFEGGSQRRLLGTMRDITARKAAERTALAEAEAHRARLHGLFMQAPAVIAILRGPEHTFELANATYRRIVGDGRELCGRPIREALPELGGGRIFAILDEVFTGGEAFHGTEVRSAFGRPLGEGGEREAREEAFYDVVFQPTFDPRGRVDGVLQIAFDVTERVLDRRRAEQLTAELKRSNEDLDQFAYVTSHDLKAPLRGIANLSQWVEEDLEDKISEEGRGQMRLLRGRVHRLEALINGILSYSRAGRIRESHSLVDVGKLAREVVELLAPPPEVQVTIADDLPTFEGERVPLQQVLMNLVENAIKHAGRPDARVSITCSRAPGGYSFMVKDNGPGIAPAYHQRVWVIFQTLEPRDKVEATGIGLSIVKKIVESRGGRVWISSVPGAGAELHFSWPARAKGFQ